MPIHFSPPPHRPLIARTKKSASFAAILLLLACTETSKKSENEEATVQAVEPPAEAAPTGQTRLRTVYVPAYSHLPNEREGEKGSLLSVLLSVRNVDARATISLTHVDYFDTSGHRVRRYLKAPRTLQPLETAEFSVTAMDKAGGSGANFLVYWEGPSDAHSLLTEAVMLGNFGSGDVAFTSRGVELERRPDPQKFTADPTQTNPSSNDSEAP